MEKNDIKKALYREKPVATRMMTGTDEEDGKYHWYCTSLTSGAVVAFKVPEKEMGESLFESAVPAQLLIRWLVDAYTFVEEGSITQCTMTTDTNSTVVEGNPNNDKSIFPSESDAKIG